MSVSKHEFIKVLNLTPKNNNNNIKMSTIPGGQTLTKKSLCQVTSALAAQKALSNGGGPNVGVALMQNGQAGGQSFILVPQQQLQQNVVLGQTVFQTSDGKKFVFMSGPNKQGIVATKIGNHNLNGSLCNGGAMAGHAQSNGDEKMEVTDKDDSETDLLPTAESRENRLEFPVVTMASVDGKDTIVKQEKDCGDTKVVNAARSAAGGKRGSAASRADCSSKASSRRSPSGECKRKARPKLPQNASSKKVISLFRGDVPPPAPNTAESAICTFHEHTLVRMATRGFWGGDRGPIQDVFRTIRTDVGDQTYGVEDITVLCYNLVKQKLDDADNKEPYYMYMKSYVDEFDGVMERVHPVTTIAMMLYLPMAEDYASTTWHGVPPTGWSEYRRAVIMREVFEVMYKFGLEKHAVPEYQKVFFDCVDTEEELCVRPYLPCWNCSKEDSSPASVLLKKTECRDATPRVAEDDTCSPCDGKNGVTTRSAITKPESSPPDNEGHSEEPTPSIISAQFAESIASACANTGRWPKANKPEASKSPCAHEQEAVESPCHVKSEAAMSLPAVDTKNTDTAQARCPKNTISIADLPSIKRSRYYAALWLGKAPQEAEILFVGGNTTKLSMYLEEFPLEKCSPPRGTKIIVDGKTYSARDVLGHFRRGVQLVEHSYNTVTNSNTTSTLKGTVNGGIVRKVPPYKISKLIHPGLHLETYTSRILSVADEESGLVKRSIRRARCRFRRTPASPMDSTRQSSKRSTEATFPEESSLSPPLKIARSEPLLQEVGTQTCGGREMCDKNVQFDAFSDHTVCPELPKSNALIQEALLSSFMTSLPSVLSSRCSPDEPPLQSLIDSYKKTGEFLLSLAHNLSQTLVRK